MIPSPIAIIMNVLTAMQHKSVNVPEVRKLVKQQFQLNANVTDPAKLTDLKNKALTALTNYVMFISQRFVATAHINKWRHSKSTRWQQGGLRRQSCLNFGRTPGNMLSLSSRETTGRNLPLLYSSSTVAFFQPAWLVISYGLTPDSPQTSTYRGLLFLKFTCAGPASFALRLWGCELERS
jgi:hypothetical protein